MPRTFRCRCISCCRVLASNGEFPYGAAQASKGEFPYGAWVTTPPRRLMGNSPIVPGQWAQHSGIVLNFDTCLLLLICDDTDLLYRPCLWQKCLFPDPRVLGVQRTWRHSLALRARDPGAVRLVFCPSVHICNSILYNITHNTVQYGLVYELFDRYYNIAI